MAEDIFGSFPTPAPNGQLATSIVSKVRLRFSICIPGNLIPISRDLSASQPRRRFATISTSIVWSDGSPVSWWTFVGVVWTSYSSIVDAHFRIMPYQIRRLSEALHASWDQYVERTPTATFFHRAAWQHVLQETFGHHPHYHYVESDGKICGALPLLFIRSRLFGNRLTSSPFCVAGSPVSESAEIDDMLDRKAISLLHELGADYIEYRDPNRKRGGWIEQSDLYATFLGKMEDNVDRQLKRIPRKQRAVLRKAMNTKALTWTLDESPDDLYPLYALSVRNLGTPVFPKRYFHILKQEFDAACEILTVRHEGRPISSVLNFYFRDRVMPYYTEACPKRGRSAQTT